MSLNIVGGHSFLLLWKSFTGSHGDTYTMIDINEVGKLVSTYNDLSKLRQKESELFTNIFKSYSTTRQTVVEKRLSLKYPYFSEDVSSRSMINIYRWGYGRDVFGTYRDGLLYAPVKINCFMKSLPKNGLLRHFIIRDFNKKMRALTLEQAVKKYLEQHQD